MMGFKGTACATQAGFFAALASVCAKIAASSNSAIYVSKLTSTFCETVFGLALQLPIHEVSFILRVCGVAGIFLCNALMWVLFTKSMHLCSSVLEATALNTASNFFCTAFLSFFLFGEQIGLQWYMGSVLMVIGLVILHKSSPDKNNLNLQKTSDHDQDQTDKEDSLQTEKKDL